MPEPVEYSAISVRAKGVAYSEMALECSIECDNTMALNDSDRAWIQEQIRKAASGWMPLWLKESVFLAVVLAGGGFILRETIPDKIRGETADIRSTLGSLSTDVGNIKTDVSQIRTDLKETFNKFLERAYPPSTAPGSPKPSKTAKNVIEDGGAIMEMANQLRIALDPALTNRFGLDAIAASADAAIRGRAWNAAAASLRQRTQQDDVISFVRGIRWKGPFTFPPLPPDAPFKQVMDDFLKQVDMYSAPSTEGNPPALLGIAIASENGFPAGWGQAGLGSAGYLRLVGKGQPTPDLDGFHFRNIVFENLRIVYKGGSLTLENVTFINCSFDFQIHKTSINLAVALLKEPAISFKG